LRLPIPPSDPVFSWTAALDLGDLAIGPPFPPEDELVPGTAVLTELRALVAY
jgi:hypothetical protein